MDFAWNRSQEELFERIASFTRTRLNNERAGDRDRNHEWSEPLWRLAGEFGLLGLSVPTAYGGMGLDTLTTAGAVEAFGRGCEDMGLVFSACAHLFACVMPIVANADERQRPYFLPKLASGEWVGANAITEAEAGSDVFSLRTTATWDGDFYVLNGAKTYVTNGPVADVYLVYASTNPDYGYLGVSAFLVEKGTPGLVVGKPFGKVGLTTSPVSGIYLEDCRVPSRNLLGKEGNGGRIFESSMAWERACLFAGYLGNMDRTLAASIDYAKKRKQGGKAIGQYQAISHKIVDMKLRLESARLMLYRACWLSDQKEPDMGLAIALAKVAVSEAAVQSGIDAIRIHGGSGVMHEVGVERSLRDALPSILFSGTSEVQRNIAARKLGL